MAITMAQTWKDADYTQDATDEEKSTATVTYLVFNAADEAAAVAYALAHAPVSYQGIPLATVACTGRVTESTWEIEANYEYPDSANSTESLSGAIYISTNKAGYIPAATLGVTLDRVKPAAARTGGTVQWFVNGALQSSGGSLSVEEEWAQAPAASITAVYSHPAYDGELEASCSITDRPAVSGSLIIASNKGYASGSTLTAVTTRVKPAEAQSGGSFTWYKDGSPCGSGDSYSVPENSEGANLIVVFTPDSTKFSGELEASASIGSGQSLGGTIELSGSMTWRNGGTFGVSLASVTPEQARTGGTIEWYRGGSYIGKALSYQCYSGKKDVTAVYTHPDYNGKLTATCAAAERPEERDDTYSFSIGGGTRLIREPISIASSGGQTGALMGLNPDTDGNPQGIEVPTPALCYNRTVWVDPQTVTPAWIKSLGANVGKIISEAGFEEGSCLFQGAEGNRGGDDGDDWWQISVKIAYRPTEKVIVQLATVNDGVATVNAKTVTKKGWQYVNTHSTMAVVNGRRCAVIDGYQVCDIYETGGALPI